MNPVRLHRLVVVAALALGGPTLAQEGNADHAAHHRAASAPNAPLVEGEVRKVDREQGKVTLRHGPIANLGMDAMTMVFRSNDPGQLAKLKVGDKVRFAADKVDGVLTVTAIRRAESPD